MVRSRVRRSDAARDGGQHLAAGRLGLASEGVRVNDRGTPAMEEVDHGRLSRGDVAGEGDVKHGRRQVSGARCRGPPDTRHPTPYNSAVWSSSALGTL